MYAATERKEVLMAQLAGSANPESERPNTSLEQLPAHARAALIIHGRFLRSEKFLM
jgi:hypothetical protein